MGKLLLAVAAVASLYFPNAGHERMTQAEIIITPMPPVAGQTMRIEYTGKLPATIDLDWHPSGEPKQVTIPEKPGFVEITVPRTATSLWATDPTGEANSVQTVVQ